MALPKEVKFVSFDCYGTLIDWETGVYEAFQKEADRDGFTVDREALVPRFIEIQRGSYELYAEVLRRTAVRVARELGWDLEPSRSNFLPNSVPAWQPFRETNAQLERFAKKYELGILSNIDDKLLGATRRHLRTDLDLVVTAQQVRSYKPDPAHFKECARRIEGNRRRWVHIASGYPTDVDPCLKQKIAVIWVNRHGEELEAGAKKPDAEVKTFRDAGKLLKAA
jgi:2-haloacid dehalogenase